MQAALGPTPGDISAALRRPALLRVPRNPAAPRMARPGRAALGARSNNPAPFFSVSRPEPAGAAYSHATAQPGPAQRAQSAALSPQAATAAWRHDGAMMALWAPTTRCALRCGVPVPPLRPGRTGTAHSLAGLAPCSATVRQSVVLAYFEDVRALSLKLSTRPAPTHHPGRPRSTAPPPWRWPSLRSNSPWVLNVEIFSPPAEFAV